MQRVLGSHQRSSTQGAQQVEINALAMEVLDDQWIPHFAKLEAGEVMTTDLAALWHLV